MLGLWWRQRRTLTIVLLGRRSRSGPPTSIIDEIALLARQPAALQTHKETCHGPAGTSLVETCALLHRQGHQQHLRGSLFIDRAEALRFAMFENGCPPQAVVMVPGVFEFDLSAKPSVLRQPAGQIEVPRAHRVTEGLLSFPLNPTVVPA